MPLPIAPVVGLAVRYGAVAAIGALVVRASTNKHDQKNAAFEASFDQIDEGLNVFRTEQSGETQYHAHHGHRRSVWLGRHGIEIDSRVLGRFRVRKVTKD